VIFSGSPARFAETKGNRIHMDTKVQEGVERVQALVHNLLYKIPVAIHQAYCELRDRNTSNQEENIAFKQALKEACSSIERPEISRISPVSVFPTVRLHMKNKETEEESFMDISVRERPVPVSIITTPKVQERGMPPEVREEAIRQLRERKAGRIPQPKTPAGKKPNPIGDLFAQLAGG